MPGSYKRNNRSLTGFSKALRKRMTREEKHLWYDFLQYLPVTIHRQKVIGVYIADFYIPEAKIIIELDGSQHFETVHAEKDRKRDAYMERFGILVLRYVNEYVNRDFSDLCEDIQNHIEDRVPGFIDRLK
jgi:very-short-patch-repair endonuclease